MGKKLTSRTQKPWNYILLIIHCMMHKTFQMIGQMNLKLKTSNAFEFMRSFHYGPARAGPLYEIRIWEAYAFLRDEFDNRQASADSYLVYGICQGLPSDILSIYKIIYFNGQYWLYTWYFILYVKKFGGFFNFCCSFTHVTCYLYRSLCMIYL